MIIFFPKGWVDAMIQLYNHYSFGLTQLEQEKTPKLFVLWGLPGMQVYVLLYVFSLC